MLELSFYSFSAGFYLFLLILINVMHMIILYCDRMWRVAAVIWVCGAR